MLLQSPTARIELFDHLDQMTLTSYGRPVDTACMMAYLLLSLAPVHQNVHEPRPDAIDVLGALHGHGSRLGLEMLSVKALNRHANWGESWYEEIVQRCLLVGL